MFDGQIFGGGGAAAQIVGPPSGTNSTWAIIGSNSGSASFITGSATGIGALIGGGGTNTFKLVPLGNLGFSGTIDGGSGQATLDFSAYKTALNVTLQALGNSHGFNGTVSNTNLRFSNVDYLIGPTAQNPAVSTLTGMNAVATWDLDAIDTYTSPNPVTSGTNTLTFFGFTNLVGGTASDTFHIALVQPVNLTGGGGLTRFVFQDGARVTGKIDGGSGANASSILDWTAYATARRVALTAAGSAHGFNGSEASIGGGFTNIDTLYAPSQAGGTLIGLNNAFATWDLGAGGLNTYSIRKPATDTVTNSLEFAGFTQLTGGTLSSDTFDIAGTQNVSLTGGSGTADFAFADGASVTGEIDGGEGTSTLDWSAYRTARNVLLTGPGIDSGFDGTEVSIAQGFSNINTLIGPPKPGSTLTGDPLAVATWTLPAIGPDTYTSTSTLSFSGFTNLVGGLKSDTFMLAGTQAVNLTGDVGDTDIVFDDGAIVNGTIDGGAGRSTLDWSAYLTARNVVLKSVGNENGFNGTDASITGGFANIRILDGPDQADGTLAGLDEAATWTLPVNGPDTYTGTNTLTFAGFTNLVGGTVADTFNIAGTQDVSLAGGGAPPTSSSPTVRA